jgi:hypothetical protein
MSVKVDDEPESSNNQPGQFGIEMAHISFFLGVNGRDDCVAGKPYCYETPVHLDSPIDTPWSKESRTLSRRTGTVFRL